jgi:signal transduction histidine kinase
MASIVEPVSAARRRQVFWRDVFRDLFSRRIAVVALLCFVVSTQVLFNPSILEDWTLWEVFAGWLEQFLDALFVGGCMLVAVTLTDQALAENAGLRLPGFVLVVVLAGFFAVAGLTVIHYPAGYYPATAHLAGEALRFIVLGTLVTLVWAVQKRNARARLRLQRVAIDSAALNRRMLEAELQVMEAQIEPHFLFNTLATVKRLYRSEPRSGERMLESLGHYLEHALPRFRNETTTLGREFDLVRSYLDVLQIRMGERLRFTMRLPAELAAEAFPPMMLITLVENAIKHGLNPSPAGGSIDLAATASGGVLEVRVADTGLGFRASSGSGIGLANIRSRLTALYGGRGRLTLESNEPSGVVAAIVVPHAPPESVA